MVFDRQRIAPFSPLEHSGAILVNQGLVVRPQRFNIRHDLALGIQIIAAEKKRRRRFFLLDFVLVFFWFWFVCLLDE